MDKWEFAQKIDVVKQQLYRTAYLYLGNESDALEAVDEAVYLALRALRKLRKPEFFETWITRILINTCHKELRRRKRFIFSEETHQPEQTELDNLDYLPLKEAISRLPEELRAVIILRYFAGLSQIETSAVLEIPQGTVATRQRRALQLLKLDLGEEANP